MSAPRRVSNEHVKAAIQATQGNITQAAAVAGIAANSFRRRLEGVGMGPAELARLRGEAQGSARTLKVSAELFERLRQAKFDLQVKLRRELDERAVVEMFMETFGEWLDGKLERR